MHSIEVINSMHDEYLMTFKTSHRTFKVKPNNKTSLKSIKGDILRNKIKCNRIVAVHSDGFLAYIVKIPDRYIINKSNQNVFVTVLHSVLYKGNMMTVLLSSDNTCYC